MRAVIALLSVSLVAATPDVHPPPPQQVQITIPERAGVARRGEVVRFGVPVPRQWNATSPNSIKVAQVPHADVTPLARWGSHPGDTSAPIKWALVACPVSVDAGQQATLTLKHEPRIGVMPPTFRVTAGGEGTTIGTGPFTFVIAAGDGPALLTRVVAHGSELLQAPADTKAMANITATKTPVVGSPKMILRKRKVTVEYQGQYVTIVRVVGSILDAGKQPVLDYTARLHFPAHSGDVRIDFTVENNHPIIPTDEGQPSNAHNLGAANSVYIGSLALKFRLAGDPPLTVLAEKEVKVVSPTEAIQLYQRSSGGKFWNAYVGRVGWADQQIHCKPRLQAFFKSPGFRITQFDRKLRSGHRTLAKGDRSLGWMAASRGDGDKGSHMTLCMRNFWQNAPKIVSVGPDGTIGVDLFPGGGQFRHNLRVGEQKTHSMLLSFGKGAIDAAAAGNKAKAFQRPLVAVVPPAWFAHTGVLGDVPAADLNRWPLYERYVRTAFEPNPDFDPTKDDPNHGNRTLTGQIERYNFYGWQDYGDVPLDYEAFGEHQAGQMNLKYWMLRGMLVQFCRSGEPRWMDLAAPAARHLSDIDILHIPDGGATHWAHGAYFGHSQHDEPGNANPNRNSNSPSVDLFYGVADLLLAYHLTGEKAYAETASEAIQSVKAMSAFSDFCAAVPQRQCANMIMAYLAAYRHTGDKQWLTELRKVVNSVTDLSNKGWVTDPAPFGKQHPGELIKTFMLSQNLWALGQYLDFCGEYGLKDPQAVKALRVYADFIVTHAMKEYTPGRAAMPYAIYFDGTTNDQTYMDINNWALVAADALAYAFKHSGDKKYLAAAGKFYATGTIDPVWKDDPPVYMSSKDLANACTWGLVYMNQQKR